MYKMAVISKIAWKNSDVEVIDDINVNSKYFWLNGKQIETKIGHSNLLVGKNKCDLKYKKCRFQSVDEPKCQEFRRFIRNDLAEKLMETLKTRQIK